MILDLLFNIRNIVPEARFAPEAVPIHLQMKLVEVGEARERNKFAEVTQVWNAAENTIEVPPSPISSHISKIFRLILSKAHSSITVTALQAEEDNHCDDKWQETVNDRNPASRFIVFIFHDGRVSAVILVILHKSIACGMKKFR